MKRVVSLLKSLSDENRLRILKLLEVREMCVCELQHILGLSQPAVSHHLKVLYNAGLVDYTKEGLFINYRLTIDDMTPEVKALIAAVLTSLSAEDTVKDDLEKAKGLKREDLVSCK